MLGYCRAFAAGFTGSLPMCGQPQMDSFSFACSASRVLAIVVVVYLGCAHRISLHRVVVAASGIVMAISGFALAGGPGLAEGTPFALFAGIASGIAMLAMLMLLSGMRISDIVFSAFGGLVVGGVLIMGLMRLPAVPATAILVVSGLGCGLLLAILDPDGKAYRADGLPEANQAAAFPWFAAVMFAISGFLGSAFYGVSGALGWNPSGQVNYPLFGIAVVLVLGLTAYIAMQGEETAVATWIPLFGLLLLAMALACFDDPSVNPSVEALLFAAVFSYHFLRWMVFPILVSFSNMPRLFICGIILVATSSFFGVGWGTSTAEVLPEGLRDQSGFVAVVALMLLIVFAAALFVNRTRLETAQMQLGIAMNQVGEANERIVQLAKRIQEEPEPQHTLEDRCNALGEEFGLTSRELEILLLTSRGHSSTFIAEQLFISASTVRFHQQNIYRKLDVHSRQELLAKVNEEAE